jgi:phosphate transport system substrate-binding protein
MSCKNLERNDILMKRNLSLILVIVLLVGIITGCSKSTTPPADNPSSSFDANKTINLVSREDGSGTRGAFVEIVGILEKDSSGNEVDRTYEEAIIQNSTDAVMTTVAGDKYSIGYISLGSLNDTVKAIKVENVEATADNVKNGSYKIARPFNLAYKDDISALAKDFLNFVLSKDGQDIVTKGKYVSVSNDLPSYTPLDQKGDIVVAGSTSVTPIVEKLAEAYQGLNQGVNIEIQSTGSSAGIQSVMEGTADIGMASRELKDSELKVLKSEVIAIDGIAVITGKENIIDDITIDQIKSIYIGEITKWNEVAK